jgi:hypothetical protein
MDDDLLTICVVIVSLDFVSVVTSSLTDDVVGKTVVDVGVGIEVKFVRLTRVVFLFFLLVVTGCSTLTEIDGWVGISVEN